MVALCMIMVRRAVRLTVYFIDTVSPFTTNKKCIFSDCEKRMDMSLCGKDGATNMNPDLYGTFDGTRFI